MKKIYLIDSENVGDVWVPLLVASQPDEEVFVFYTQKSPHMNYENVRKLKETEKEAIFIKCFEGNNALDFQLVTELGYMLQKDQDCEYIIVSNDTGFDAVVRYWSTKNMPVRRLSGKDCSRQNIGQNQNRRQSFRYAAFSEKDISEEKGCTEEDVQKEAESAVAVKEVLAKEESVYDGGCGEEENRFLAKEELGRVVRQKRPPKYLRRKETDRSHIRPEHDALSKETDKDIVVLESKIEAEQKKQEILFEQLAIEVEQKGTQSDIVFEDSDISAQQGDEETGVFTEDSISKSPVELEHVTDAERTAEMLLCCIGKDNLADFHNALVMFLGEETGKELYQKIKGNPEYIARWAKISEGSQKEKFHIYCRVVFAHSELADDYPQDFSDFLLGTNGKRKNLNSLRAALQGQYGKDRGMKYYSLFKSHIKIMNRM